RRGRSGLAGCTGAGSCFVVSVTGILTWLSVVTGLLRQAGSNTDDQVVIVQATGHEWLAEAQRACLFRHTLRRYYDYLGRSEEHTSELQSRENLVCRLLLEKKKTT